MRSATPRIVAVLAAAAALVAGSFFVPVELIDGGGATLEGFWVATAGFALAVSSVALLPGWRRCGLLAALFVLGTAAQLDLTHPMWLQFVDLSPGTLRKGTNVVALAVLAFQVVVVAVAGRRLLGPILAFLRGATTLGGRVVAAVLFVLVAAHAAYFVFKCEKDPEDRTLFWVASWALQLVAVGSFWSLGIVHLAAVGQAIPRDSARALRQRLAARLSLPGADGQETASDRMLPWVLAAFVTVSAATISWQVLERVPHIPDSAVYLFQASGFAQGVVTPKAPPSPESFACYMIAFDDDVWYAVTNPGFALVLAVGVKLGVPWLVNPVLGGICVLLAHRLARRLADRGTAHLFALLVATSPWFLFLAASMMTHVLATALLLGAWFLVRPASGGGSFVGPLGAGLLLGYMVVVRPLDGVVVGGLTGVWLLFVHRAGIVRVVSYSVGCVVGALPAAAFNALLTGSVAKDPFSTYVDRIWYPGANRLGFGAEVGNPPGGWGILDPLVGHGLPDALLNANQNLYNIGFELFGWAVGSLALAGFHLLAGKTSRVDRWFLVYTAVLVAAYSTYWFSGGPDFGARYWFSVFVPCVWWTVRGLSTVVELVRQRCGVEDCAARAGVVLALLTATTLTVFVPWRAVGRYVGYRNFHGGYRRLAAQEDLGNALVFVRAKGTDWVSAMAQNRPGLPDGAPVFARWLDPETDRKVIERFPGRRIMRVEGPSVAGTLRIVEDGR